MELGFPVCSLFYVNKQSSAIIILYIGGLESYK